MKNVIYQIRNVVNGHYYVGSTVDSRKRFWAHRKALRTGAHDCVHLQRAWNKYGEDCFVFEILKQLDRREDLFLEEQTYIAEHFGRDYFYNVSAHAASPMRDISAELRTHLSQKTKEYLARHGSPRLGKTHSEETRAKLSASKLANPTRAWAGKSRSEETKAKISATQKGRPNLMKGKKMSEQGRANVIAAVKRGEASHFYGKRPTNAEAMMRPIVVTLPDGSVQEYPGLSATRAALGVTLPTIIRSCRSGLPLKKGPRCGYSFAYADDPCATSGGVI
jgi:predicted GIY-YIG superfamily endonuclease